MTYADVTCGGREQFVKSGKKELGQQVIVDNSAVFSVNFADT